jgi:hypothetical protein
MTSRSSAKAAKLKVVPDLPDIELGGLSEHYKALKHQTAVDLANDLASADTPEWAGGMTVLNLLIASGGTIQATLEGAELNMPPEPVILRSTGLGAAEDVSTHVIVEGLLNGLLVASLSEDTPVYCVLAPNLVSETDAEALAQLMQGARVVLITTEGGVQEQAELERAANFAAALRERGIAEVAALAIKTPLIDILSRAPDTAKALQKLLAGAQPIEQLKAAAQNTSFGFTPYVSTRLGEVVEPERESVDEDGVRVAPSGAFAGYFNGEKVYAKYTLMTAAPIVTAITTEIDIFDPRAEPHKTYGLDVQVGPAKDCKIYPVEVDESLLASPMLWRDKIPTDAEHQILFGKLGRGYQQGLAIGEAIRQTISPTNTIQKLRIKTVTWMTDEAGIPRWVDAKGAHGPRDKTPLLYQGVQPQFEIPSPDDCTPDQINTSVDNLFFNIPNKYVDTTVWMAGIGFMFNSLAGGHPHGVLWYAAEPESGKSVVVGMLMSIFGPTFGTKSPMEAPTSTQASFQRRIDEINNGPIGIDDYHPRGSKSKRDAQEDAIDQLLRVGYTGGKALPTKAELAPDKKSYVSRPNRDVHPTVVIAGESLPPEDNASGISRLFVVDLPKDAVTTESVQHLLEIENECGLQPAAAAFLRWRAGVIETGFGGDINKARRAFELRGQELAKPHLNKLTQDETLRRLKEITTTPLTGLAAVRDFLVDTGRLTEKEADTRYSAWAKLLIVAAKKHAAARLTETTPADLLLQELRGAVDAGRLRIGRGEYENDRTPMLGFVSSEQDGTRFAALIPAEVKKIATGLGMGNPGQILLPHLITEKGHFTKLVRHGSERVRAYAIPLDKWRLDEEEEDNPKQALSPHTNTEKSAKPKRVRVTVADTLEPDELF